MWSQHASFVYSGGGMGGRGLPIHTDIHIYVCQQCYVFHWIANVFTVITLLVEISTMWSIDQVISCVLLTEDDNLQNKVLVCVPTNILSGHTRKSYIAT